MPSLNVFAGSPYQVATLTDRVNKMLFVPGLLGRMGLFTETNVTTTVVWVEERAGVLELVQTSPRGSAAQSYIPDKRKARPLATVRVALEHDFVADDVQNVRAFGSETEEESVQTVADQRAAEMLQSIEATHEWHRMGAARGVIYDADGTTVIKDLFSEFGVSQVAEFAFNLGAATGGQLLEMCDDVNRTMQDELGATPFDGVLGLMSSAFAKDFKKNAEVRDSYLRYREGEVLRSGRVREPFVWGDITWVEVRGTVSGQPYVPADKCLFVPMGAPGVFRTVYGPADFMETANVLGRPVFSKMALDPVMGQWARLHVQSQFLSYCTRPRVLLRGRRGA